MTGTAPLKKTPFQSKIYFYLAVLFMLLPSVMKLYTGETQRLVVASGHLSDPHFNQGVVFIFRHTLDGAVGVLVNKPLSGDDLKKAPSFLSAKKIPLFYGGPLEFPDTIVVLENLPARPDAKAHEVKLRDFDEAVKADPAYLDKVATSIHAGKDEYRVYLGMSGWGFMQLGKEFRRGDWASTEFNADIVFNPKDVSSHDVWQKALSAAGDKRKPVSPGGI